MLIPVASRILSELGTRVNGFGETGSPVTDSHLGEDGESFSRENTFMFKLKECPGSQDTGDQGITKMLGTEISLMMVTSNQGVWHNKAESESQAQSLMS